MSKLIEFEIIKPIIENDAETTDNVVTTYVEGVANGGELIELYIHRAEFKGKGIVATITIEVEEEDD